MHSAVEVELHAVPFGEKSREAAHDLTRVNRQFGRAPQSADQALEANCAAATDCLRGWAGFAGIRFSHRIPYLFSKDLISLDGTLWGYGTTML